MGPYKAIIHLMLAGGMDSFSVLVPKTCSGTNPEGQKVNEQYTEMRGPNLVIDDSDLTISPNTNQPCEQFVINKDLPYVKELYDNGDLLFFANTGVVNKNGMTRANYDRITQTRLFAHNTMQEETKKIDPYSTLAGSGIGSFERSRGNKVQQCRECYWYKIQFYFTKWRSSKSNLNTHRRWKWTDTIWKPAIKERNV